MFGRFVEVTQLFVHLCLSLYTLLHVLGDVPEWSQVGRGPQLLVAGAVVLEAVAAEGLDAPRVEADSVDVFGRVLGARLGRSTAHTTHILSMTVDYNNRMGQC